MILLNEKTRSHLTELIGELNETVDLLSFKSDTECQTCNDTIRYLEEISALNSKIRMKVFDRDSDKQQFEKFDITKVPAIVIKGKRSSSSGIKFYGIPSGYEVHSLIAAIKRVSKATKPIDIKLKERILCINKKVNILVFVTPTCPNCPDVVIAAHTLAFYNTLITCTVIECGTFSSLASEYNVKNVPKTIINDIHSINGLLTLNDLISFIENL
ncbi:MAG: protein disulfide oxidoreductase [Deltaproteobacteria bacterium]